MVDFLIVLFVVIAVVAVVSAPLRRRGGGGAEADAEVSARAELADLEAAKEAKYQEIRDAELDHRTGKLSAEDFASLDGELRAEAIALLRTIDAIRERPGAVG